MLRSLRLIAFFDHCGRLGDRSGSGLCAGASAVGAGPHAVAGALGDPRRLAGAAAEVIELGPANHAATNHLDRGDARRIERKNPLHPLPIGDLAQSKVRVDAGVLAADAHALENLDALALVFDDLDADPHRVTRIKPWDRTIGKELFDLLLFELLKKVHRIKSLFLSLSS